MQTGHSKLFKNKRDIISQTLLDKSKMSCLEDWLLSYLNEDEVDVEKIFWRDGVKMAEALGNLNNECFSKLR